MNERGNETPGPPPPSPGKYVERALDDAAREYYRRLSEEGAPATTHCPACEETSFPPRLRCRTCGGETAWVELPTRGTLYAFTAQEAALRHPAPALLAMVQLGDVVLPAICGAAYEDTQIGDEVEVEPLPEPEVGLTLLRAVRLDHPADES